jgi:superfamily I DNA/RNA helicase
MSAVVAAAVRSRERALPRPTVIGIGAFRLKLGRKASGAIVEAVRAEPGTHNERRPLLERVVERRLTRAYVAAIERAGRAGLPAGGERPKPEEVRELLSESPDYRRALERMWPVLTPERLLDDLFGLPALLDEATETLLDQDEVALLARERGAAWTAEDIPLLDEARALLGTRPARSRRASARDVAGEEERARHFTKRITDDMFESGELSNADPQMVRDVTAHLMERASAEDEREPAPLFPRFGHVVVDEAQELSPMQWRMLARRAASSSMTVVGDLNQASGHSGASTWDDVVTAIGAAHANVTRLTVNYRTPSEVMALADRLLDGAAVSGEARCVRDAGIDPMVKQAAPEHIVDEVAAVVECERAAVEDGKVGVIAPDALVAVLAAAIGVRREDALDADVTVLSPEGAKGLEFDAVIVVEPSLFSHRALYVALTRTTTRLTLVHSTPLPPALTGSGPGSGLARGA